MRVLFDNDVTLDLVLDREPFVDIEKHAHQEYFSVR